MTSAQLKKLEREWAAKLRASGFQDIESPSGMVQSWDARSDGNLQDTAALAEDARREAQLKFADDFERRVWALHVEGRSNRTIAKELCVYRKLVDQTMWRLQGQLRRRRPGPKRNPEAMSHDRVNLTVRLSREAAEARAHVERFLPADVTLADLVRMHILELALKTPIRKAG